MRHMLDLQCDAAPTRANWKSHVGHALDSPIGVVASLGAPELPHRALRGASVAWKPGYGQSLSHSPMLTNDAVDLFETLSAGMAQAVERVRISLERVVL